MAGAVHLTCEPWKRRIDDAARTLLLRARRETVRLDRPVAELIAEDREERDRELAGRSSLHE
ncbi:MAG: hypothetical protein M3Q82_02580 [Actinomycetota bacterium]|nr:hypothetical protein [Actinomycetota bacterium]